MKLQIIEPMSGGHHTNYVSALMPSIKKLLSANQLREVVVTITERHFHMLEQRGLLPIDGDHKIWMDPTLRETPAAPSLRDRQALFGSMRAAIRRQAPDAVLCTTADYDILNNAAFRLLSGLPRRSARRVGAIHFGLPASAVMSPKGVAKRLVYEAAWRAADLTRLLIVNPLIYEDLKNRKSGLFDRITLLPDPVPQLGGDKLQARRVLGIPEDGRYIAFVGAMDARKAIPELCAGFAAASLPYDTRLLLAGRMHPEYKQLLKARYTSLLDSGRILLLERQLSDDEVLAGYAAADVNAVLQYPRANLSANVLKAVGSGRPVLVGDYGHAGMVVRRFRAGVVCDVSQISSVSSGLAQSLNLANNYELSANARRLIEFHDPENFARVALFAACGADRTSLLGASRTWEWVCQESGYGDA